MINDAYRQLTSEEISQLINQRCKAENWNKIHVSKDFKAKYVVDVTFSGDVSLGCFGKLLHLPGGVPVESGIYKAHLHQCTVGDDVYISHVSRYIANYVIGEGAIIENIGVLYTEGESSFGNGTSVSVLDETGGRSVSIYEGLSVHTAWLIVMYTHLPQVISVLTKLALDKAKSLKSAMGEVGPGSSIRNSGTLRNLRIGAGCEINGASLLDDGSLCSATSVLQNEKNEPLLASAYVGSDVIAKHFIFAPGSVVKNGVQLERCFVGEAAELSNGFSAHDSLFFANAQLENGEACASFVGPYTVSMHKGTLMVGGMYSFGNFGSSTNQSNHFYKLGPMHSGILERGCKTSSGAYILWPAKIGAYSFIKGSHVNHPNTTDYPFSYLLEDNGKSYLSVGAALRSIGTLRDELKWPQRDKRTTLMPSDKLIFESHNVLMARKLTHAMALLTDFISKKEPELVGHGFSIKASSAVKGLKLYQTALDLVLGSLLIKKMERLLELGSTEKIDVSVLIAEGGLQEDWLDAGGLLVTQNQINVLCDVLQNGSIQRVEQLEDYWETCFKQYDVLSWQTALQIIAGKRQKVVQDLTKDDFLELLEKWQSALSSMLKTMLLDAEYEWSMLHLFTSGEVQNKHAFVQVLEKQLADMPERTEKFKLLFQ